ncbi:sugar transferase [Sphingomonas canadensis]|uniref:Sugar transferase n=1 Tax=Sphingomonas canadensis TaxID=1219257 RepID=A0ABW3H3S4_9SPHN|nr:sugar transferase [Sphingomonas canadensis]MCW3835390.1 sugar transferase [Sphingomonas canadensis]
MLMTRDRTAPITRSFWESLGFQLIGITVAALFVPLLYLFTQALDHFAEATIINSAIASYGSAVVSLFLYRRVTSFPGTRGFAYIIPTFTAAFGIAVLMMFGLRLPYSGAMLATGYVASMVFGFLATHLSQKFMRRHFYLVPFGNTEIAYDAAWVQWIVLHEPRVPDHDRHGAIVADLRHDHPAEWERMLAEAAVSGRVVYHTKQLRESLTGRVEIEHLSENSFGSLLPNLAYRKIKRTGDVMLAAMALPLLAVPLLLIALWIRLDSPGPVLFRQQRMGYRSRPFDVLKFRTMEHRPDDTACRDAAITQDDDQRITRAGRFLRRTRIDELPQLVNVLRGEMSLIGPRPEALALSEWYERELPFYSYRHIVRPGITGWAQVNQGHVAALHDVHIKLHYDFYYIKHFSAWLDILIMMRTVGTMLTGFGSK